MSALFFGPQVTRKRPSATMFASRTATANVFAPPINKPFESRNESANAPESVRGVLRRSGLPLHHGVRQLFESRLGDLSGVRVHADNEAASSAAAMGAAAYTWKHHLVFGAGRYRPETQAGQRLLAHELVHVAQQRRIKSAEVAEVAGPDHPLERNARAVAEGQATPEAASHAMVQRQGTDETPHIPSLHMRPQAVPAATVPVILSPLPADLQRLRLTLMPGPLTGLPSLPRLRLGERPSPQMVGDTARDLWLPLLQRPEFEQTVVDAFLRAQGNAAAQSAPGLFDRANDQPPSQDSSAGQDNDQGPDVTHQTLVGYDPQNTAVLPRSQHVRGSGVGAVVDQAGAQWNSSAWQHTWHSSHGSSRDVTFSLLTAPTIQAQTEGFPQPGGPNNQNVPSTVQQASFAAGGQIASMQVGPDDNPRLTVGIGQVTGGPQAGSVQPRAGGPAVPSPTQFVFGFTPLQVEVGVHRFCDGGRLGIGISAGGQIGVTPGQSPVLNFAPSGITFTYHQGNADTAKRGCR